MYNEPDKTQYIKDEEFIRNINYINSYGANLLNQTTRPYIDTTKVIIPSNFSFDNIENLLYINDTCGRTEFIVFNKYGTFIELTQYLYVGFDYDRRKVQRVQVRYTIYDDINNDFEKFFEEQGLNKKEFFKNKKHFAFLNQLNLESTYINITKMPNFSNKFEYTILSDTHNEYLNTLWNNINRSNNCIYNYKIRIGNESMMELANNFLNDYKIRFYKKPKVLNIARQIDF